MTDVARDRAGRVIGVVVRDHLGATWTEHAGLVVGADGRDLAGGEAGGGTDRCRRPPCRGVRLWVLARSGPGRLPLVLRRRRSPPASSRRTTAWPVYSPPARRRCSPRGCATVARLDAARAHSGAARLPAHRPHRRRTLRARCDSSVACRRDYAGRMDRAGRWLGTLAGGRIRCPPTESPTRSAMPSCWLEPLSPVPRRTRQCGPRYAATRPNETARRCRCIQSSTGSPPISGTWPKSNSCYASFPR